MQDREDLLQHMQNYDLAGRGTMGDLNRHIQQQKQARAPRLPAPAQPPSDPRDPRLGR